MSAITLGDLSLKNIQLSPPLAALREAYFRAAPEVCPERPALVTKYSLEAGLFKRDRITSLDKARLYRRVLENRQPVIWHTRARMRTRDGMEEFSFQDTSPFAGSTTSRFKGVPIYPEFLGLGLWPELWTISKRKANPYYLAEADAKTLNFDVFPHWMEHNITELARSRGSDQDRQRMRLLQMLLFFIASKPNCISHTIPDFSRAVREGLRRVIEDAQARHARAGDPAAKEFYQAVVEVLEGIITYARRLADQAASMSARETDPSRKAALEEIARVYRRVPEQPAESFREGLTTVWLCWVAIHLENMDAGLSLGRLDQILYDLYRRDIDAGRLTVEQAVELLGYLWLKIGDHVPAVPNAGEQLFGGTGSNQAITIGGVDEEGRDAVNDLTYVMLRATELMMLRDPNLNARYHPEVHGDAYLRRLCEANINTGATPALHNDRAVIQALTASGHTLAQARDYGVVGCVEPGSNGRMYSHSGALLVNLPAALELALFNGRHRRFGMDRLISIETGEPSSFTTFAEFREAFRRQAAWLLDQAIATNDWLGRIHQQFHPTPILSALFEGPMEKSKDLIDGGAVLNASGIAIIGMADVADSLTAVETLVFQEGRISFATLRDALLNDFKGHEELLTRLRDQQRTPRFGNDHPQADASATWLLRTLDEAIQGRSNYRGGNYRIGYWTMTNHAGFGRLMGATPNGRKAGENFSSGITPNSGVTPFLTSALRSVAELPPECVTNGMAFNLKFTPEDGERGRVLDNFVAAVKGYFEATTMQPSGGMEIQFNVTSHRDFLEAVKDPSRYDQLLVRVSGYTAYFKDLNPQMQKEIIERTEYRLSTGEAVSYGAVPLAKGAAHG